MTLQEQEVAFDNTSLECIRAGGTCLLILGGLALAAFTFYGRLLS
jgi:hypothetical protein